MSRKRAPVQRSTMDDEASLWLPIVSMCECASCQRETLGRRRSIFAKERLLDDILAPRSADSCDCCATLAAECVDWTVRVQRAPPSGRRPPLDAQDESKPIESLPRGRCESSLSALLALFRRGRHLHATAPIRLPLHASPPPPPPTTSCSAADVHQAPTSRTASFADTVGWSSSSSSCADKPSGVGVRRRRGAPSGVASLSRSGQLDLESRM
jgi:hypothetical protein